MRKASSAAGLAVACLLSTASIALAADPGTEDPNNWPQYNRTANAWRYSPLDQINKDNVGKLSVAWIAHGGDITMGLQETPLVIDGVIYSISSGDKVAALDGKTGQTIWSYEPKLDPITKKVLFSPYSRGVAVGHGMVFIGTVDGRGIALDPKSGKLKWYRQEIVKDVWDYDAPYEVMLFKKDGKDVIVHLNKSGYVFVLDKNTGNIENIRSAI